MFAVDRFAFLARQRRSLWVFCRFCDAAMKTCFVVLEQSEKTGSDESRVLQAHLRPQNTIPLRSSCGISSRSPAGQSQIHAASRQPRYERTRRHRLTVHKLSKTQNSSAAAQRARPPKLLDLSHSQAKQRRPSSSHGSGTDASGAPRRRDTSLRAAHRAPALHDPSEADDGAPDEFF